MKDPLLIGLGGFFGGFLLVILGALMKQNIMMICGLVIVTSCLLVGAYLESKPVTFGKKRNSFT
jgi:hypothetical protein